NSNFSGTPVVTGVDRVVDIPSTGSALKTGLPADNESVRWSGEIFLPAAGNYSFFIKSLGQQRLTINGVAVINDFAPPRGSQTEQSGIYAAPGPGWVSIIYDVV